MSFNAGRHCHATSVSGPGSSCTTGSSRQRTGYYSGMTIRSRPSFLRRCGYQYPSRQRPPLPHGSGYGCGCPGNHYAFAP